MLTIDNLPTHKPYIGQLLRKKFSNYKRLVIKKAFDKGLSGSDVFMIRTIKTTGAEMPSVIKIDSKAQINREWTAYGSYIQRRLPGQMPIDGEPTYTQDQKYGLLWYPLAGQGNYEVTSLLDFLRQSSTEIISSVLPSRLFKNLNTLWKSKREVHHELSLRIAYDPFLPPIRTIEIDESYMSTTVLPLRQVDLALLDGIEIGEWINLEGLKIDRIKYNKNILVLNYDKNGFPLKIYAKFNSDVDFAQYETGKPIRKPLFGKISKTRSNIIQEQIEVALGNMFDSTTPILTLPNQKEYPNPLFAWEIILNKSFDVYVAPIHGDLNINNILIEKESGIVNFIDFPHAGKSHVLHDLIYLEMSLITTLLAETIWNHQLNPSWVCHFYENLHEAISGEEKDSSIKGFEKPFAIFKLIRDEAKHHLFEAGNWSEYYHGLFLCFLGAMKFSRFDENQLGGLPKQTLVWGMAVLLNLIEQSLESGQSKMSLQTDSDEEASQVPIVSDNLVEGDENIIGEGNMINIFQNSEYSEENTQKGATFERNEIKGNKNIIGSHNKVNRKK